VADLTRDPDQPSWARPILLVIAALSAVAYSTGAAHASLEPYYGAAARSMSQSWRDFVFGAFDPSGTVTVDKLPRAPWPQALSLRVFGFHIWAFVLPQVIEGVITIVLAQPGLVTASRQSGTRDASTARASDRNQPSRSQRHSVLGS
jgi:4-amino-4-deoxy-L-arabinose transferase-like glycosyltransferase